MKIIAWYLDPNDIKTKENFANNPYHISIKIREEVIHTHYINLTLVRTLPTKVEDRYLGF